MNAPLHNPWRRLESSPRWNVPEYYNVVDDTCDRHAADKLAMIWDDGQGSVRQIHWGELQRLSECLAGALWKRGVTPGDRVVTVLGQSPETAAMMLAVLRCGAVLVTLSELLADREIRHRVETVDARLLITESRIADRFETLVDKESLFLLDRFDVSGSTGRFPAVRTPANSTAFIAFTSGTTGPAKGVMLPHRVMQAGDELTYVQDLRDGEVFYGIGDWSWWVRKILGPWKYGAVNLGFPQSGFDPEKLLYTLARHRVTNAFINATAIRLMMDHPTLGARYPQQFRVVSSSNEPLGRGAFEWFQGQFGVPPLEFYGCTEVGIMMGSSPHVPIKPGTMGLPLPGWTVRALDDEGREVPPGEVGEICLLAHSNPNYPLGYWRREEESTKDFGGTWFHTKDLAVVDEDGYFTYVSRKDDVIKASGYRIGPHEVEAALCRHPAVLEAAVIGVPDAERGSRVVSYVVLREGQAAGDALVDALKLHVKSEHSAYAYPREIRFIDRLPRSTTGKIDRTTLRRRFTA